MSLEQVLWDYLGISLRTLWDHFRIFGVTLASFAGHVEVTLHYAWSDQIGSQKG